jgi:phosphomannomutase
VTDVDVRGLYVDRLAQSAAGAPSLSVAWDSGSGATGEVVERLVPRLPGRHVLLSTRVDGRFPDHHPDPAVEANLEPLKAAVLRERCDLGLAFDGDGDRIGVVDETGAVIWADQLLLFLAGGLLHAHPGATVVADVKSSGLLFEGVERLGGIARVAPSGYVLVREAMATHGAWLGGELSGHVFFRDWDDGADDALYAAVRVLRELGRRGLPLSAFRVSLPARVATPELRIPCPEARKAEVVREAAERTAAHGGDYDPQLGLRVRSADGWWLLRASGTEPKLTARCEAPDDAALARLVAHLRAQLAASGVEIGDAA